MPFPVDHPRFHAASQASGRPGNGDLADQLHIESRWQQSALRLSGLDRQLLSQLCFQGLEVDLQQWLREGQASDLGDQIRGDPRVAAHDHLIGALEGPAMAQQNPSQTGAEK